jgi:putative methyltransferase (TIGR04325 family)
MSIITETFPDFTTAMAACGAGYADRTLTDVIALKTRHALQRLTDVTTIPEQMGFTIIAVTRALASIPTRPVRVLDFGGACGMHCHYTRRFFNVPVQWAIVETPSMVRSAASFAGEGLSFHERTSDALASLGGVDLLYTSGAIQYVPEPMVTLVELRDIGAPYFALMRLSRWDGPTTVGVQDSSFSENALGPTPASIAHLRARYPVTFNDNGQVLALMGEQYFLDAQFRSPSADYTVDGKRALGASYLFRSGKSVS